MDYSYYERFINKNTRGRYDVTPLFGEPKAFSNLIADLSGLFRKDSYEVIVGIDALGFIIGGAMAHKLGKRFVPVRKGGKLPGVKGTVLRTSSTDYTGQKKALEMNKGSIHKGERVLIVDEWIETGAQIKSAIKLIVIQGGKVVGVAALCAERNPKTRILFEKYNCRAIKAGRKI